MSSQEQPARHLRKHEGRFRPDHSGPTSISPRARHGALGGAGRTCRLARRALQGSQDQARDACRGMSAGLAPDTINPVREQPWRFRNYAFCSSAGGVTAVIANQQPNALREAAARRPTSASRRSACASSGRCSRSAARGETAECVARRLSSAATWPDRLELQSATFGTSRPSTTASAGIPLRNTLSPADYGQLGRSPLGG
jgi:hypothetical protein